MTAYDTAMLASNLGVAGGPAQSPKLYLPFDDPLAGTTVAAGSNGVNVNTFAGAGVLNVASTAGFLAAGILSVDTASGTALITYTGGGGGGTTFTGCTTTTGDGGVSAGNLATGGNVKAGVRDALGSPFKGIPFGGASFSNLGSPSIMPGDASTCMHFATWANGVAWSSFDATDQAALALPGPLCWMAWVQPDNITGDGSGNNWLWNQFGGFAFGLNKQTFVFGLSGIGLFGGSITSPALFVPNNPYFVVCTYDRANVSIYINGILQTQVAATAAATYTTNNIEWDGLLGTGGMTGFIQKMGWFASVPNLAQIQNLYIIGAASISEQAGNSLNVYPFSRQAVAANTLRQTITLTNTSDTPMFASLSGATAARVGAGVYIGPNGTRPWSSSSYTGAIQVIHSAPLGSKTLLIQTT